MTRILIVDDSINNLELLRVELNDEGYEVNSATNGEQALQLATAEEPDLILLDMIMPGLNGYETCKRLKSKPATENIPVILLSALDESDAIVDGLKVGAQDYVAKPYDFRILNARINSALTLADTRKELHLANQLLLAEREQLEETIVMRTKDLSKAKEHAEKANQIKTEFLANMSHELRTPMHAILSFTSIGIERLSQSSEEQTRHFFTRIEESGKRLLKLLNNLLDLSKLEAKNVNTDMKKNCLSEVVLKAIQELTALLEQNGQTITLFRPDKPIEVLCNADLIRQVIINVLSNAIKFSPEHSRITISYKTDRHHIDNEESTVATVSISDEGVGIPVDELDSIFDQFTQSSKTKTNAGGTGLGLSICRHIMNIHRGAIVAKNNSAANKTDLSNQTKGACFHVSIPCDSDSYFKQNELKEMPIMR